jgi:hypothetical protein
MLILQWVACSFRIPKAYEIRDGIVFHTRWLALDEATKIRDGFIFFDLCLPLLEEGPKGTIDFFHYSAKELVPKFVLGFIIRNLTSTGIFLAG